jgi:hypothetical protein
MPLECRQIQAELIGRQLIDSRRRLPAATGREMGKLAEFATQIVHGYTLI